MQTSNHPKPNGPGRQLVLLLLGLCLQWGLTGLVHAQRVALLIGNASYQSAPLRNPPNDVREMEAALTAIGFRVQKVLNANQNQMKRAVRDFGNLAQGAEVAFLYYSGHGTQAGGENYLLPIGATIDKEADYEVEAVSANALMRQIAGARPKAAIVVLDACRDNPYASATKSTNKGLSRMDAPTGTMIAFATSPNNTASDEGHYARALAARLKTPGMELIDVFRDTTADVRRLSGGKQEPRISEMSISEHIYLAGQPVEPRLAAPVQIASLRAEPVVQTQLSRQSATGRILKDCDVCPEMVLIPAGSFMMGSPLNEPKHSISEGPQHRVTLKSFLLGKTEITVGQWKAVMGSDPSRRNECGDNCPIENVSWDNVQAYIKKLNVISGKQYRLPSEAEWEYAARAGTTTPFSTGETISPMNANFNGLTTYNDSTEGEFRRETISVGSFSVNGFGLFDMHGNVDEMVQDVWHANYIGAPTDGAAWVQGGDETLRVVRGGSWRDPPISVRSASRGAYRSGARKWPETGEGDQLTGFRIAKTLLTP